MIYTHPMKPTELRTDLACITLALSSSTCDTGARLSSAMLITLTPGG